MLVYIRSWTKLISTGVIHAGDTFPPLLPPLLPVLITTSMCATPHNTSLGFRKVRSICPDRESWFRLDISANSISLIRVCTVPNDWNRDRPKPQEPAGEVTRGSKGVEKWVQGKEVGNLLESKGSKTCEVMSETHLSHCRVAEGTRPASRAPISLFSWASRPSEYSPQRGKQLIYSCKLKTVWPTLACITNGKWREKGMHMITDHYISFAYSQITVFSPWEWWHGKI